MAQNKPKPKATCPRCGRTGLDINPKTGKVYMHTTPAGTNFFSPTPSDVCEYK
jgi:hypothetical protein